MLQAKKLNEELKVFGAQGLEQIILAQFLSKTCKAINRPERVLVI